MVGGNDLAAAFWSLQQNLGDDAMVATYDWSLFPCDLVYLICSKLPEISDAVCFRLVCRAWRWSTSLSNPFPFLPWILKQSNSTGISSNGDLQFYSPFSCKSTNTHVSQAAGGMLVGPAKGYLVSCNYNNGSLSILNPFIAHKVSLPPLKGDIFNLITIFIIQKDNQYKLILLDIKDGYLRTQSLEISRAMDNEWKLTKLRSDIGAKSGSFAFYNNMYFLTELSKRRTTILDPTGNVVTTTTDNMTKKGDKISDYLVESGGKLLRILINTYSNSTEQLSVDVYVLNVDKGYRWLETKDLDDHILFLDVFGGFSVLSSKLHGLIGNCIYFFTHGIMANNEEDSSCLLHKYELGNGNIQNLEFPFQHCGTWIFPSMCQLTS